MVGVVRVVMGWGVGGNKVVVDCGGVKGVGGWGCVVGGGEWVSEGCNGVGVVVDVGVFELKVGLECVDGGV